MTLDHAISLTARRLVRAYGLGHAAWYLMTAALVVACAGFFDYHWPLAAPVRFGVVVLLAGLLVWRLRLFLRYVAVRRERAARYLDRFGGDGRVRGAFELARATGRVYGNRELAQAEIAAVERVLSGVKLPVAPIKRPLRIVVLWILCFGILLGLGSGRASYQARRVIVPWLGLPPLAGEHFTWVWPPESYTVPHGGSVTVEVLIPQVHGSPELLLGTGQPSIPLARAGAARWYAELGPLEDGVTVEARDGPFLSAPRRIRVAQAPAITGVEFLLTFPGYTKEKPRTIQLDTDRFAILAGTKITMRVTATGAEEGSFAFTVGDRVRVAGTLRRAGGVLAGEMIVTEGGELELRTGRDGGASRTVLIECVPDRPPELAFAFPPRVLVACAGSRVPVAVDARDDFGLEEIVVFLGNRAVKELPYGKPHHQVKEFLTVPAGDHVELRITARATDNRTPVPRTTVSAARVVRGVSEATFKLLRQIDALGILRQRLTALRRQTTEVLKRCAEFEAKREVAPAAAQALLNALSACADLVTELKEDPIFKQERRLSDPILQQAEGLRKLVRSELPSDPDERRGWLSFLKQFATELLQILDGILPGVERLASEQPFLRLMAAVLRLPSRQDAVAGAIEAGEGLGTVKRDQEKIRDDVQAFSTAVASRAPDALAKLAEELGRILKNPALAKAIDGSLRALAANERDRALAAARRVGTLLRPLRDAIAARGEFATLDLLELLASIGAGAGAADELGLDIDRVYLWGPGSTERPQEMEPPPIRADTVVFSAPAPPTLAPEGAGFYRPLIEAYGEVLGRIGAKEGR